MQTRSLEGTTLSQAVVQASTRAVKVVRENGAAAGVVLTLHPFLKSLRRKRRRWSY